MPPVPVGRLTQVVVNVNVQPETAKTDASGQATVARDKELRGWGESGAGVAVSTTMISSVSRTGVLSGSSPDEVGNVLTDPASTIVACEQFHDVDAFVADALTWLT